MCAYICMCVCMCVCDIVSGVQFVCYGVCLCMSALCVCVCVCMCVCVCVCVCACALLVCRSALTTLRYIVSTCQVIPLAATEMYLYSKVTIPIF